MALSVKELLEKNKAAYKNSFYIESIGISYLLMLKALKQITRNDKAMPHLSKGTLNNYVKALKKVYAADALFRKKMKKNVYRDIATFCSEHKQLNKELKFQFPEIKLKNTAKRGMHIIVALNTTLVKLKNNH